MARVLYLSQTGMTEPLGRSQVVAYLARLARRGHSFDIVCMEPETAGDDALATTRELLRTHGIGYWPLRRGSGHGLGLKLAESARALARVLERGAVLRPQIIHARSYVAGAIAMTAATILPGARFLFDVRGLLGEEYIDAGHWTARTPQYRLLKATERGMFARADGVVVLTGRHRDHLHEALLRRTTPLAVIPCCVDLERFAPSASARAHTRARIGAGDRLVLVYAGTLGGYYGVEPMLSLFSAVRRRRPALLLVLSSADQGPLRAALTAAGIGPNDVHIERVAPDGMPAVLAGADASLAFYAPGPGRIGTSPTKIPEYLAMGLPLVLNRGVGDSDDLISAVPVVVDGGDASPAALDAAAAALLVSLHHPNAAEVARRAARERFSVDDVGAPRYDALYDEILARGAKPRA